MLILKSAYCDLYCNVVIRCKLAVCPKTIALALIDTFFGVKHVIEKFQHSRSFFQEQKSIIRAIGKISGTQSKKAKWKLCVRTKSL